jgi:integrase
MMALTSRVIQRRFAAPRFRREIKSGQHAPESVATFNRNQWPVWTGIDGHFAPEYAEEAGFELYRLTQSVSRLQDKGIQSISFSGLCDLYIQDYAKANKSSYVTDETYLKRIKEFFGDKRDCRITSQEVEKFKNWRLSQGVKPSSVNRYLALIRKIINLAIEWGYLRPEDRPRFRMFSEKDNMRERILSVEEEERLLSFLLDHLRLIVITALNTGMRMGEILNLKWENVDLRRRMIAVTKTKSKKIRHIPINETLLEVFLGINRTSPYVFINPDRGEPWQEVKRSFKTACRKAGIKNLRFHDLRHRFATRLIEKGTDIITIRDLLGHSSVRVTERYAHSQDKRKVDAVNCLRDDKFVKTCLDQPRKVS